jgi:hypothetical protein
VPDLDQIKQVERVRDRRRPFVDGAVRKSVSAARGDGGGNQCGIFAADLLQKHQPFFVFSMKVCTLPRLLRLLPAPHAGPPLQAIPE